MTIDKSLKVARGLIKSRGVLTRAERITKLKELDRWTDSSSALGLPKVRVLKLSLKKKKKSKKEEADAAATPDATKKGADAKKGAEVKKAPVAKKK